MKCRIAGYARHTMVNGPGIRFAIFFQGCPHHCKGCQNPDTWDPEEGEETDTSVLTEMIEKTKFLNGITLSGGDPFFQAKAACEIAEYAKSRNLSVWCYTGWTYEALIQMKDESIQKLLALTDVLVDGPFRKDLLSDQCMYRGSTNQRLIDMKKTAVSGTVCEFEP